MSDETKPAGDCNLFWFESGRAASPVAARSNAALKAAALGLNLCPRGALEGGSGGWCDGLDVELIDEEFLGGVALGRIRGGG